MLEDDGRRNFRYTSLYFDTPGHDLYLATARKRKRRVKVRTRTYLDSDDRFVELKLRRGRLRSKERQRCDRDDLLTSVAAGYVGERLGAAGIALDVAALVPSLRTRYRRTTIYLPEGASRATFDTELSFSSAGASQPQTIVFPELTIVETKTPGPPCSLDRLLWSLGLRPAKFSKFGVGVAALHPDLPHNKWARLLRTRLAAA